MCVRVPERWQMRRNTDYGPVLGTMNFSWTTPNAEPAR
jgi:hypothetical protein